MIYIMIFTIAVLIFGICAIYIRTSNILSAIDSMIDCAINHTFSERDFTENKLSKLEAKMYRYLSAGDTACKQMNAEKDSIKTLIADISHQTKTPLSNILLYAQLLKEAPELKPHTQKIVTQIEEQTEKLNFLVSSLIKTSRLENGILHIVPKENSIDKLLACLDYHAMADAKGIDYQIVPKPGLTGVFDFKWTLEAISNIVDNAMKYTPSGGKVTVSARAYELFVCIQISDTGIGMSEEETAKVFTRFYRSAAVSDEKGVGIGLYLAREIIAEEGGYIKVTSKMGRGSVFSVFVPKQANLSKL